MKLEQLNFHHLFYFWRVARLGHLTQAAEDLHTSQSALSAQIRQLEDRIGEDLFSRERRRLVLTDTGHLVFSYAENIFGLGQEMLGRLQGQSHGITRLRVGSMATLSRNYQENWIRPLLTDPSVVLTLESGTLEGLLARLVRMWPCQGKDMQCGPSSMLCALRRVSRRAFVQRWMTWPCCV